MIDDNGAAEQTLRRRIGIPDDAEKVIVFGDSSHWDPNWLLTSRQYYRLRIRRILDAALRELAKNPRRVFSVECIFFLRLYWEQEPSRRAEVRRLVNSGRLRLTGSGVTTPDTVLPDTEAILRDYQLGQQWLREQGMAQEPRLAYLPDDFGHSPALPALLRSLGYSQAGITRIDGMYFVGADYRRRSEFPLPGSSAARLWRELKTQDFVWRAADGSEVLCHWNAYSYFQGDMLAHRGIIRWMGLPLCVPWRSERHVARQVALFERQLRRFSRTPYAFCPIGCDFTGPIVDLVALLDRYNERRYPRTGVWVVNAGMDDYLDLVAHHAQKLPTIELDPNPYWMGFFASRPEIKARCNRVARKLVLAERLASTRATAPGADIAADLRAAWSLFVVSNHHDFITGTSPDRVWREEQRPWLQRAETLADRLLGHAARAHAPRARAAAATPAGRPPRWRMVGDVLEIRGAHYQLRLDQRAGGCIVSWRDETGQELLAAPANDLVCYRDSGGLWRMGHEYRGGVFRELTRSSDAPARLTAEEIDGSLCVRVDCQMAGVPFTRWLWLRDDEATLRMSVEGAAPRRATVTCRFPADLESEQLEMDVPGALVVQRPAHKIYDPTFWPARSFVLLRDRRRPRALAAALGGPACCSLRPPGSLEWVVLRNAPRERAFGVLPVLAHPAAGNDADRHRFNYAIWSASGAAAIEVQRRARVALTTPGDVALEALASSQITIDRDEAAVAAVKRADRGDGVIVRLHVHAPDGAVGRLAWPGRELLAARLCDARERDLAPLPLVDHAAEVPLRRAIVSVRLLVRPAEIGQAT